MDAACVHLMGHYCQKSGGVRLYVGFLTVLSAIDLSHARVRLLNADRCGSSALPAALDSASLSAWAGAEERCELARGCFHEQLCELSSVG